MTDMNQALRAARGQYAPSSTSTMRQQMREQGYRSLSMTGQAEAYRTDPDYKAWRDAQPVADPDFGSRLPARTADAPTDMNRAIRSRTDR